MPAWIVPCLRVTISRHLWSSGAADHPSTTGIGGRELLATVEQQLDAFDVLNICGYARR